MDEKTNIDPKFLKPYSPIESQEKIKEIWDNSGFANPDICIQKGITSEKAEKFSMILPPPNVTGILHMGHAVMLAIQDTLTRYNRMQGKRTLWLPGTDHAAIATQAKVEKLLEKEKIKKKDLGREEFLKRVDEFAKESHGTITEQIKEMGASVDWSREAFTLDKKRQAAVYTAFKQMYDDGLIYRGQRVVNWDPKAQTAVSDDEVEYEERPAILYTFKYSKNFPFSISTTRPETKFGDTAVAVNPDDNRYKEYIGQELETEFCGTKLKIKVIADENVDPEFGTGALGVTPAHSLFDWDMAQENDLEIKTVIDHFRKMQIGNSEFDGLKTDKAKELVVEKLRKEGLLEKEEETTQNVPISDRSKAIIEPLPKLQWFIDVKKPFTMKESNISGIKKGQEVTLKEIMIKSIENADIEIFPDRFKKIYFNWVNNLKDWCISRQIWYGHQIPVWYHENKCVPKPGQETEIDKCKDIIVSIEKPKCEFCDAEFVQDPDTLDTWFSSGLWTFSTLGWPEETEDLKNYHPTDILETGEDILFFWVARMVLFSGYFLGQAPFKNIYLHGMVRDKDGKKMSKSVGNTIDPVSMCNKYGADAVRMSLMVGIAPGNDIPVAEDKIKAHKKFANKIWNASRFVMENTADLKETVNLIEDDKKILAEFKEMQKEITTDIENLRLYLASEKLYHYFWHQFADIVIEKAKQRIQEPASQEDKKSAQSILLLILTDSLKLLHPFMPFVTEDVWSAVDDRFKRNDIDSKNKLLMVEKWPN